MHPITSRYYFLALGGVAAAANRAFGYPANEIVNIGGNGTGGHCCALMHGKRALEVERLGFARLLSEWPTARRSDHAPLGRTRRSGENRAPRAGT